MCCVNTALMDKNGCHLGMKYQYWNTDPVICLASKVQTRRPIYSASCSFVVFFYPSKTSPSSQKLLWNHKFRKNLFKKIDGNENVKFSFETQSCDGSLRKTNLNRLNFTSGEKLAVVISGYLQHPGQAKQDHGIMTATENQNWRPAFPPKTEKGKRSPRWLNAAKHWFDL